jgi:5'-nucleotidase
MRAKAMGAGALLGAIALAACGSSGGKSGGSTTTKAKARALRVLVSNDDGFSSPGIDALVNKLRKLGNIEVTVVAPLKNQSGAGDKTTPGTLTATEQTTSSGYAATAVDGYPADAVGYALDQVMKTPPDLVATGVNDGQNIGYVTSISGTLGAARVGVRRGIPAIAASAGPPGSADFKTGADYVAQWVSANRDALVAHQRPAELISINVPSCGTTGKLKGFLQVSIATQAEGNPLGPIDCATSGSKPTTDVAAFQVGYVTVTDMTAELQTVTPTTVFPGR